MGKEKLKLVVLPNIEFVIEKKDLSRLSNIASNVKFVKVVSYNPGTPIKKLLEKDLEDLLK